MSQNKKKEGLRTEAEVGSKNTSAGKANSKQDNGFAPLAAAEVLWEIWPEAKDTLSFEGLELARNKFYGLLLRIEIGLDKEPQEYHPLEHILLLSALRVLKHIIRRRNESKSGGISSLLYMQALARRGPDNLLKEIRPGFIEELRHLFLAIKGRSEMYADEVIDENFDKLSGRSAAVRRGKVLDELSIDARRKMSAYTTGLEPDIIELRKGNIARIRRFFGADESDWNDWRWQLKHVIRDAETLGEIIELTGDERWCIERAVRNQTPFGITPYYASLMDRKAGGERDRAIRAQVIPGITYVRGMEEYKRGCLHSFDFMMERDTSPIDLITRRYPQIVILKPFNTCAQICVYCQRNWEIKQVLAPRAKASKDELKQAIDWIRDNPNITEVLVTGGDPGIMADAALDAVFKAVASIEHVERIRLGTRTPVVLPMRITDAFRDMLLKYHIPGKREVCVVTHYEHVYEVTPESRDAVRKLKSEGLSLYNQLVFTTFNSRRFEAAALRRLLRLIGVDPYYTFNAKGKAETSDFRVPVARLMMERKEEARLLPGLTRTDSIVFNIPRLGKNYLSQGQDNRLIMIRPDGCRVYEFLPWEKNISLVDTYVYTDVSIYDYLKRMEALGENPSEYANIWYYY